MIAIGGTRDRSGHLFLLLPADAVDVTQLSITVSRFVAVRRRSSRAAVDETIFAPKIFSSF